MGGGWAAFECLPRWPHWSHATLFPRPTDLPQLRSYWLVPKSDRRCLYTSTGPGCLYEEGCILVALQTPCLRPWQGMRGQGALVPHNTMRDPRPMSSGGLGEARISRWLLEDGGRLHSDAVDMCLFVCLFVCLFTALRLSCGGRPPTREGPYTTRRQAEAVPVRIRRPTPPRRAPGEFSVSALY